MPQETLDYPPFPPLTWDHYFWVGEVVLPSWAGFQARQGGYGAVRSRGPADGTARLMYSVSSAVPPAEWFVRWQHSESFSMIILLDLLRWFVAVPSGLLFVLCALANWSLFIGAVIGRLKCFSLVLPFLGPIFGIVFFVAVPIQGFSWYWWLALLIEPSWLLGAVLLMTWPFVTRQLSERGGTSSDAVPRGE